MKETYKIIFKDDDRADVLITENEGKIALRAKLNNSFFEIWIDGMQHTYHALDISGIDLIKDSERRPINHNIKIICWRCDRSYPVSEDCDCWKK